ncbi:uncharacterized protein [Paralichthys olivaceus]|uniref:uncharacterized protein isoform X2 n=1 Tax=Paralichthys olivaceus TaxID=8255 RepID=UPI0037523402
MSPTWVQSSLSSTFSFVTSLVHMLGFTRVPGYSNGRRSFWILKESSALIPGPRGERWCGDSSSPVADIEQSLVFVSSGDRQSRMVAFFPSSGLYTHFPQNPWAGLWLNRRKEFVNESWSTSSSSLPSDIRRLAKEMQLQPSIENHKINEQQHKPQLSPKRALSSANLPRRYNPSHAHKPSQQHKLPCLYSNNLAFSNMKYHSLNSWVFSVMRFFV